MALFEQRCLHHSSREAIARCPACKHYYCRECVVEHEGRLICTRCLAAAANIATTVPSNRKAVWCAYATFGFLFCWMAHYYLGWALSQIPTVFHVDNL